MEITIGGRKIPLFYSSYEMIAIQKDIGCTAYELREQVFGVVESEDGDWKKTRLECVTDGEKTEKLGKLIRILGNAGLEENGEAGDLTDKWVLRNIKPAMIMIYAMALMTVIHDGNALEELAKEAEQGPVDEVLEEENAKKEPGK